MMNKLADLVTGEQIVSWIVIAILVIYFVYKEWPDFKARITKKPLKEAADEANDRTIAERLDAIEADQKAIKADIKEMNEKLVRDYERINRMDTQNKRFEKMVEESLEERGILMGAMLGVLGGLQELGANGHTKEAEATLKEYLNRQAHKSAD